MSTDMLVLVSWFLFPFIFALGNEYAYWATSQPWTAAMISFGLLGLGVISLFISRLPLYRQGLFLVIGSRLLPPAARRWYRLAYWIIIPNIIFLVLLLITVK